MKKSKWIALSAMLLGGATLFSGGGGCGFSGFGRGLLSTGWPSNNRWLNLAIDILNEDLFG